MAPSAHVRRTPASHNVEDTLRPLQASQGDVVVDEWSHDDPSFERETVPMPLPAVTPKLSPGFGCTILHAGLIPRD